MSQAARTAFEPLGASRVQHIATRVAALWIALALILSGCATRSTPPGPNVAAGQVEQAGYVFLRWEAGLTLMIWHDARLSFSGEGSASTGDPHHVYRGRAASENGRGFEWKVRTRDGQHAEFTIDGRAYDLADGRVFLVNTEDGTEVQQLQRDLSEVQTNHDSCVAFARNDTAVSSFLE